MHEGNENWIGYTYIRQWTQVGLNQRSLSYLAACHTSKTARCSQYQGMQSKVNQLTCNMFFKRFEEKKTLNQSVYCRTKIPPLREIWAEIEGGVFSSGGVLTEFYMNLKIVVSPLEIDLNGFGNVKIFACGAQIWSDLQEIEGGVFSFRGGIFVRQ